MAEDSVLREENVVYYQIFDTRWPRLDSTEFVDTQGTLCEVLSYSQSLIDDYIWQNDSFNLRPHDHSNGDGESIPCLEGSTNFGDNIEDEWFIVYILSSISNTFPYLVIKINDNDGEFLLIEAAEYLPKWLEPDTSENRVFFYQGNLHIVPLPKTPSEITVFPVGKPTIGQALKTLKSSPEKTVALPLIQHPIKRKMKEYEDKVKPIFHHVLCYLPGPLKYLLERKPSLISLAVQAFVNRDPLENKTCQKLKHFSFDTVVPHQVCFTRCLYAQLVKQNFIPNKSSMKILPEVASPSYKGHVLGLQITYGFELLYSQGSMLKTGAAKPTSPEGQHWEKYLDSLHHHGYFKNELVGSKLYCQLMEKAKEYFSRNCLDRKENCSIVTEIEDLLKTMPVNVTSDNFSGFPPDDDKSWLEVSPEELESILSQYGVESGSSDVDLNNVVHGMNSFVEKISSYEGAEFPSELDDKDEIQFNPDDFMKSMESFFLNPGNNPAKEVISEDESSDDNIANDEQFNEYTNLMDKELSDTNISKSFVKMKENNSVNKDKESECQPTLPKENSENIDPVDIDLNLVQNFLESYSLQEGLPGPVSNIMNSMGICLPQESD